MEDLNIGPEFTPPEIPKRKRGRPRKIQPPATLPNPLEGNFPSQNRISLAPEGSADGEDSTPKPQELSGAGENARDGVLALVLKMNPALEKADPAGVSTAIQNAIDIGLDPTGVGGFARIMQKQGVVALILGYNGMAKLALESGELAHLEARPVYDKDIFALDHGRGVFQHAPYGGEDGPGAIIGAYAKAIDAGGRAYLEFVPGRTIKTVSDELWTMGMTAEECCRKVAFLALLDAAPLNLRLLRHALNLEKQLTR